jgi:acetyl esterase/lipase
MITDWTRAYDNRAAVPGHGAFLDACAAAAARFRAERGGLIDVAYGIHPRERLDLFTPQGTARGLMVFIHGGYWRTLDKDHFSHLAAGMLAHGWAVAIPSYPLCPEVPVAAITHATARAVEAAAQRVAGPLVLCGHSAGGHLAVRMVCSGGPLAEPVARRVARVMGISGVYDLRPLMRTAMNADLRLDMAQARAESPVLMEPRPGPRVMAWVGAAELPEFVRQNAAFASVWHGLGADMAVTEAPGRTHFDVLEPLAEPGGAMVRWLAGMAAAD